MSDHVLVLPDIYVEAGLTAANPVQPSIVLKLDDATNGKLNTNQLANDNVWYDLSTDVKSFTVNRPSTRQEGPLYNYQAGTLTVLLDNSNGKYDPDNSSSPFFGLLSAMVPIRIRSNFGSEAYPVYSGFADGWVPAEVSFAGDYAELTLGATDGFKVLAGINLPTVSITGVGADTGARVKDLLTRASWYTSADKRLVDTGDSTLQGTTLGDNALALMQLAVDSEIGQLYINGAGAVVFRHRRALLTDTRSNTVQAVFGDEPGTLAPEAFPIGVLNSNPGFIGNISPWTSANSSTISYDTTFQYGPNPGTLAFHGNGTTANPQTNSEFIPATAGTVYTAFVATYVPTGSGIQAKIDFFDSGQSFLSGTSFSVASDTDAWNILTPSGTAPASTAFIRIAIQSNSTPASGVMFYVGYGGVIAGTSSASAVELACSIITRSSDDTLVVNDVQAQRNGGTLQEVQDATSQVKYLFPRTYDRTDLILQDDLTTLNWAQWVLYVGKTAESRFESIQIDPQSDPFNLWPQVLGREIGDRIQIWRRPPQVGIPIVKDCFIVAITHDWNSADSKWLTTFTLQDASKYGSFLTLDNPTLGRLDNNGFAF